MDDKLGSQTRVAEEELSFASSRVFVDTAAPVNVAPKYVSFSWAIQRGRGQVGARRERKVLDTLMCITIPATKPITAVAQAQNNGHLLQAQSLSGLASSTHEI